VNKNKEKNHNKKEEKTNNFLCPVAIKIDSQSVKMII